MNIKKAISYQLIAALSGCAERQQPEQSRHVLRDILNQANMAVSVRCDVLEKTITNGMPIPQVVQLLGTNYKTCYPYSMVMLPPLREADKRISIEYSFPQLDFMVETSSGLSGDPLGGVCIGIGHIQRMEVNGQHSPGDRLKAPPEK